MKGIAYFYDMKKLFLAYFFEVSIHFLGVDLMNHLTRHFSRPLIQTRHIF